MRWTRAADSAYGAWDKQTSEFDADVKAKIAQFDKRWEAPETGIELVLVKQTSRAVLRRFLDEVVQRYDYPKHIAYTAETPQRRSGERRLRGTQGPQGEVAAYAATLLDQCKDVDEVPEFLRTVLIAIDQDLRPPKDEAGEDPEPGAEDLALLQ